MFFIRKAILMQLVPMLGPLRSKEMIIGTSTLFYIWAENQVLKML